MKKLVVSVVVLCMAISVSACSAGKPEPDLPSVPSEDKIAEVSMVSVPVDERVSHESIKDLNFSVPWPLEAMYLLGAEESVYVPLDPDAPDGMTGLSIMPQRLDAEENDTVPTALDSSGRPILTAESAREYIQDENFTLEALDSGQVSVGGKPASYIEIKARDNLNMTWQLKLTRVIHSEFRYDLLYVSGVDHYPKFLPVVEKITESVTFASDGEEVQNTTFGDIALQYPARDVSEADTEQGFSVTYTRDRDNLVRFYMKMAPEQYETEDVFDDADAVDRLFRARAEGVNLLEPREISREEINLNGKRAIRSIYHDDFREFDNYLEMTIFIHHKNLYTVMGQAKIGNEDRLHSFIDPIIASFTFGEANFRRTPSESIAGTINWINYTYAIITLRNGGNIDLVGGFEPTEENVRLVKDMLLHSWSVQDRASLDEALHKLYTTGHRSAFLEFAKNDPIYQLEREDYQAAIEQLPDDEKIIYENSYDIYRQFGDDSLLAWDYCRMLHILGSGYIAGYYTYEEALDESLKLALELQGVYSSWDDLYRNYLAGFHFWQPGNVSDDSTENYVRFMIWMMLTLSSEDGPYAMLWDTKLAKDW